tara:strand:- start:135 stop:476 length:342 start_codon:yes stop_codon:yes gene_type:complete
MEGEDVAPVAVIPQGANWVFRGRQKPRERNFGSRPGNKAFGNASNPRDAKADNRPQRKDARSEGRREDGRNGRNRNGAPRDPAAGRPSHRSEPERPAGGGAFAGLAELLGRKE